MMVSPHAVPGPGHDNNTQCSARTCVPTLHRPHRPARPCPAHLPYKVTWAGLLGSPHSNAHFPSPAQMCSTMGWWQPPTVGTLAPSPAQPGTANFSFYGCVLRHGQQQQGECSFTSCHLPSEYGDQVQPGQGSRGQLSSEYSANAEMFRAAARPRPAVIV